MLLLMMPVYKFARTLVKVLLLSAISLATCLFYLAGALLSVLTYYKVNGLLWYYGKAVFDSAGLAGTEIALWYRAFWGDEDIAWEFERTRPAMIRVCEMACDMLKEKGAVSVRAVCTHPVLSGKAYERIAASALEEFIVTDTIPLRSDVDTSKFSVLSIAPIFAEVIEKVYHFKPISDSFVF